MKWLKREMLVLVDDDNIPIGAVGWFKKDVGNRHIGVWIEALMASKSAPRGTGVALLEKIMEEHPHPFFLGVKFSNWRMLSCAIRRGFRIIEWDSYGYILGKE